MARYIDADVLHIKMEDLYEHHIEMKNFSADGAVADCLELLDNTPTADVEEVKYSQWHMYGYDEAMCMNCGYVRLTPFESTNEAKAKWNTLPKRCEDCGAKMDGGKEE